MSRRKLRTPSSSWETRHLLRQRRRKQLRSGCANASKHGPILASMIGRLYHETQDFGESFSRAWASLCAHTWLTPSPSASEGAGSTGRSVRRGAPRAFLAADSKQLKKRTREDSHRPRGADTTCSSQANGGYEGAVGGHIGERGLGAYAISAGECSFLARPTSRGPHRCCSSASQMSVADWRRHG